MTYKILCLDGGGIRGLLVAKILERLEATHPGFLAQVDLLAGTSTGGVLALGLAAGLNPRQIGDLYEKSGARVFADSPWDDVRDLGKLIGADYDNQPLKEEILNLVGEITLAELGTQVLISSFHLDNNPPEGEKLRSWKPKFFHNFPGEDSDGDERVVDVALRTSAAPTFFPIYQNFVDGGVVANNPSMCALAQALHPKTGQQRLEDVRLLSIGTGVNPKYLTPGTPDWGLVQWAPHLISLMMDGSVGLADYQCRQVLGKQYLRINPVLPVPISLERLDQIPLLKEIGETVVLEGAVAWLETNWVDAPESSDAPGAGEIDLDDLKGEIR